MSLDIKVCIHALSFFSLWRGCYRTTWKNIQNWMMIGEKLYMLFASSLLSMPLNSRIRIRVRVERTTFFLKAIHTPKFKNSILSGTSTGRVQTTYRVLYTTTCYFFLSRKKEFNNAECWMKIEGSKYKYHQSILWLVIHSKSFKSG